MNKKEECYDCLKLENQFCFPLYAASRKIVKEYTPYLKPLNITYTQYITLMVLWEENEMRIGDLGKKLFLDTGTLTPLLKKMEDAGLLTRTRSKEDERVVYIKITEKGMALREAARDIPKKMGGIICLSKEEAAVMRKALCSILKEN
jgi:DNA-binding MarR family transcriptional regulator